MLTRPLSIRLPRRRSRVMSQPPPAANRVPFAKSAPSRRAWTNCGISAGSAEPSASTMAMISSVAASNPQARALPLLKRFCLTIRTSGRSRQEIAVRVVRAELAADLEFRNRFGREVAAARRVSGVFTAMVVDTDVDGPTAWLAAAYVRGPSLHEAINAHGPLPAGSLLTLAAGLAESPSAIRAADVVHRDLKPSNVLLAEDGPRVIDFGISRAAESEVPRQVWDGDAVLLWSRRNGLPVITRRPRIVMVSYLLRYRSENGISADSSCTRRLILLSPSLRSAK